MIHNFWRIKINNNSRVLIKINRNLIRLQLKNTKYKIPIEKIFYLSLHRTMKKEMQKKVKLHFKLILKKIKIKINFYNKNPK